jgi:hypothetical protein
MPGIIDSTLTPDPSTSLIDVKFTNNRSRSRQMDLIFKTPLNTRVYFLFILLIVTILALLTALLVIKLCDKPVQSNTTTPPGKLSTMRMMSHMVTYRRFFSPTSFTLFTR